ncbi:MAG: OadG family protein [Paramuribaculum sp.]|nr:OadG family protein [Paramuribaculum sp.]
MKKKLIIFIALLVSASTASVFGQSRKSLKINEVMVTNENSVVDDYGNRHGWIELFNSSFAPLEISSVYLTDDPAQPKKYPVPLGDVNTKIPKRQHVLFWADGEPSKGTFHTNFVLKPGQDNWIGIYDADGLTLIDEVVIPADLQPNMSYARKADGEGEGAEAWEVRSGLDNKYVTPSSNNIIKDTNNKVEMFAERDKNGLGMTITAMGIVFLALVLLSTCFMIISKIGERTSKGRKAKAHGTKLSDLHKDDHPETDSGEVIAAIVMALHEHLNAHDKENTILTINKVRRAYSPWSSKIYNMRENPRR